MYPENNSSVASLDLHHNISMPLSLARSLGSGNTLRSPTLTEPHESSSLSSLQKRRRSNLGTKTTATGVAQLLVTNRSKKVRGRRGSLQSLPEMPLDILFEVGGILILKLKPICRYQLIRSLPSLAH